jgi:hypothetical protein
MQWLRTRQIAAALVIASIAPMVSGCGDDNIVDSNLALLGSWNATVLLVDGVDLIDGGMTLSFTFNANGEYSYSVTGDLMEFCEAVAACTDGGDFTATSTQFTLDPDSIDSVVLAYSVTGGTLSVFGTVDGFDLDWTFQAN